MRDYTVETSMIDEFYQGKIAKALHFLLEKDYGYQNLRIYYSDRYHTGGISSIFYHSVESLCIRTICISNSQYSFSFSSLEESQMYTNIKHQNSSTGHEYKLNTFSFFMCFIQVRIKDLQSI